GGWPDYLGGLRDLVEEWLASSRLYWLAVPLGLVGLAAAIARWRWALPLVLWGALQAAVYQLLGVASYSWYYAPLIPGAALLIALGAQWIASGVRVGLVPAHRRLPTIGVLILAAPLLWTQLKGVQAL